MTPFTGTINAQIRVSVQWKTTSMGEKLHPSSPSRPSSDDDDCSCCNTTELWTFKINKTMKNEQTYLTRPHFGRCSKMALAVLVLLTDQSWMEAINRRCLSAPERVALPHWLTHNTSVKRGIHFGGRKAVMEGSKFSNFVFEELDEFFHFVLLPIVPTGTKHASIRAFTVID